MLRYPRDHLLERQSIRRFCTLIKESCVTDIEKNLCNNCEVVTIICYQYSWFTGVDM